MPLKAFMYMNPIPNEKAAVTTSHADLSPFLKNTVPLYWPPTLLLLLYRLDEPFGRKPLKHLRVLIIVQLVQLA